MATLKRQTWKEIRREHIGQWVELVDFEWDWGTAHPSSARVRNSSPDRNELVEMVSRDSIAEDSVILFVADVSHSVVQLDNTASVN